MHKFVCELAAALCDDYAGAVSQYTQQSKLKFVIFDGSIAIEGRMANTCHMLLSFLHWDFGADLIETY